MFDLVSNGYADEENSRWEYYEGDSMVDVDKLEENGIGIKPFGGKKSSILMDGRVNLTSTLRRQLRHSLLEDRILRSKRVRYCQDKADHR
jgi:hypothetical protein